MANEKEVISYNFNELFYQLLIDQLNSIRGNMIMGAMNHNVEHYKTAFREIIEIFNNINHTILTELGQEWYDSIVDMIVKTKSSLFEYESSHYKNIPKYAKMKLITKYKYDVENNIDELHRIIMKTIDKLGMLFKKDKRDDRLPIYRQ